MTINGSIRRRRGLYNPLVVFSLTLASTTLPSGKCFAHPALPISNARPPKQRFGTDNGGAAKGKSTPISGTPFRGISRRVSNDDSAAEAPPSQIESIVANAKSISTSMGKKIDLTDKTLRGKYLTAITAGLAVSLAMIPEAVSFSFVAGVNPLVGLWTTVVLGFFAALFGGRAGIQSSASGACSVVVAALCASHGSGYLAGCAALSGLLQITSGALGVGKLIRLVPHPVMVGFVNGLAVVMLKAQLGHFKGAGGAFLSLLSPEGKATYGCALLTMALVRYGIPALQEKVESAKAVPPTLGGVNAPLETLRIILPYAVTMAAVGSIESLLTLQLLDGIVDDGKRGSTKKEVIGQGIGNLASGLTGGIGGCALIGQSLISAQSGGGVSKLSGMAMSIFLALGIVAFAPLLGQIPVVSLAGVMLLVCQSTFSWGSLRLVGKIPNLDAFIIALVTYVTIKDDLAKAVLIGTITSALGFAWKQSTKISTTLSQTKLNPPSGPTLPNVKTYNINGPLFFGSTQSFSQLFRVKEDPDDVVIDFTQSRVYDHSALEAINSICDRYGSIGKRVYLRRLSSECAKLLAKIHKGGLPPYEVIEVSPSDPVYDVADDE
ncbi:sulfate permease family inorganic anion transporter [Skeletonema marinoi]|uniref:Sulfate permease family inorganic anion transporter n=1 Tax=Skeletonema marinoi TaxID=267567 RepID=A0AAD8XWS0_9STRA|nr:sulfate permease family inorganic anion transporter [Skeletonema marinoi]